MASETVAVRMHEITKATLDLMEARINKERKKLGKAPLTKAQIISLAIENLTVDMGSKQ